ncbi:DUF4412 domain-containing protein [Bacteroidales bacterium]|nr:DUF4412 domain-containing protein [Bacteroidales bacterium]
MKKITLTFIAGIFAFISYAGNVVHSKHSYNDDPETSEHITYVQNNKIKASGDGQDFIVDLNSSTITIIMHDQKEYVSGNISELKKNVGNIANAAMDQALANVPEAQREQMKAMMEQMASSMTQDTEYTSNLEIKKTGTSATIAGKKCNVYEVVEDGNLVEKIWLCENWKPYDAAKFMEAVQSIVPEVTYESTDQYLNLIGKGAILKTEDIEDGSTYVTSKIVEKNLSSDVFSIPSGYKKVDFSTLLQ